MWKIKTPTRMEGVFTILLSAADTPRNLGAPGKKCNRGIAEPKPPYPCLDKHPPI